MIYKNPLALIGNTPIIEHEGIFIKLEQFNLAGSIKDRVALNMISELESQNKLNEDSTVIEVTSGNTGIAIAMICAIKRYKCLIITTYDTSKNKINLLKAYGANIILTPSEKGLSYAIEIAKNLSKEPGYIYLNQFENINNPLAHNITSNEIINDLPCLDYLVCGIGTGGTICGISRNLKKVYPNLKVIGVLPKEQKDDANNHHGICGIGANIKSSFLDPNLIDDTKYIETIEVYQEYINLVKKGLLLGLSSVANIIVAKRIKEENPNKIILVISSDSGYKYLDVLDASV